MAANTDGAAAATAPPQVRNPYQSTTTDTNTIAAIVHSLGRSNNTVKNDKPALEIFAYWRRYHAHRSGEISREEIEGDSLQYMMLLFFSWLGNNPIPSYWRCVDGEIRPPKSREDKDEPIPCIGTDSLVKYAGRIIAWFRRAFPDHPDFSGLDPRDEQAAPAWWTRCKPKLEREIDDMLQRFDNDFTTGARAVRPLYENNKYTHSSQGLVQMISLTWIVEQLMRKGVVGDYVEEGALQQRAWLVNLYLSAGRPGEIKFIDTNNWMWHPTFEITDTKWVETKTNSVQAMPMFPRNGGYLTDWYHCLGSFFACEGGLFRPSTVSSSSATYLFPHFQGMKDNSVANKIMNTIRNILPSSIADDLKKSFSGKSLRVAAATFLLMTVGLNYTDVCGRTGHDSGTTVDTYQDKECIVTGMRGGKALAGFKPDADVKVPKIDKLPNDSIYRLMSKLFIISEPMKEFRKEGNLHMVLCVCAASLIMYHNDVVKDFGESNAVASKLRQAAEEAKITDQRYPNDSPAVILRKWSDEVKESFKVENSSIVSVSADGTQLAAAVNQQTVLLQQILATNMELRESNQRKDRQIATLQGSVYSLNETVREMGGQLTQIKELVTSSRTPRSSKKRQAEDVPLDQRKSAPVPAAQAALPAAQASQAASTIQPLSLSMTNQARTLASGTKGKGVMLATLLSDFSNGKRLRQGSWSNVGLTPKEYEEPGCLKLALELCEYVCTSTELATLREGSNSSVPKESILQLASAIQLRAFKKMWTLEGFDAEIEYQKNEKKPPQNAKQPTYMAIGKRVRKYKKKIGKNSDDPLCERPTAE